MAQLWRCTSFANYTGSASVRWNTRPFLQTNRDCTGVNIPTFSAATQFVPNLSPYIYRTSWTTQPGHLSKVKRIGYRRKLVSTHLPGDVWPAATVMNITHLARQENLLCNFISLIPHTKRMAKHSSSIHGWLSPDKYGNGLLYKIATNYYKTFQQASTL